MAELFTFGDEAGIDEKAHYCFVVGWIGAVDQWESLRPKWREVLNGDGLEEFRAKDFFDRRRWQSRESPYYGWKPRRATRFINRLLAIIHNHDIHPVGGGVDIKDFHQLSHDERKTVTGGAIAFSPKPGGGLETAWRTTGAPTLPYFAGFILLIEQALARAESGSMVQFVFDEQKHYEGRARMVFREIKELGLMARRGGEKLGDVTYADSKPSEPLQVADLYAYTMKIGWGHQTHVHQARPCDDLLRSYNSLIQKRVKITILNAASFKELVNYENDAKLMKALHERGWV